MIFGSESENWRIGMNQNLADEHSIQRIKFYCYH